MTLARVSPTVRVQSRTLGGFTYLVGKPEWQPDHVSVVGHYFVDSGERTEANPTSGRPSAPPSRSRPLSPPKSRRSRHWYFAASDAATLSLYIRLITRQALIGVCKVLVICACSIPTLEELHLASGVFSYPQNDPGHRSLQAALDDH